MTVDVRKHLRRVRRTALFLSPGLIDASFSALAGFATSLYAVNTLEGPALGAYALYFSAFLVASLVPAQLLYTPLSVAVLSAEPEARMKIIVPMMRMGLLLAGLAGIGAALAGVLVANQVDRSTLVALAASVALLVLVSPIQDHMRSTFHLARRPLRAAAVSVVQLAAVSIVLPALYFLDVPDAWLPFGSLALANVVSTVFGLFLISKGDHLHIDLPPTRQLLRSGMTLLPAGMIAQGSVFASAAILAGLASAGALGTSEAARIVSRPVFVLAFGISRAVTPRLMEAGNEGARDKAMRTSYQFLAAILLAGGALLAVAGWSHPFNPFEALAPRAYTLAGLTALTIAVTTLSSVSHLPQRVLIGAGKNGEILVLSIMGAVTRVALVTAFASQFGAYAISMAQLGEVVLVAIVGWNLASSRVFRRPDSQVESGSVGVGHA